VFPPCAMIAAQSACERIRSRPRGRGRRKMRMRAVVSLAAAVILAAGIALAGWLAGEALKESREPLRTVTVKGLSERDVTADLAFWPIRYTVTGATLDEARTGLDAATASVEAFLSAAGFAPEDWSVQSLQVEDRFAQSFGSIPPGEVRFLLTE